jgi:hypothetical protein
MWRGRITMSGRRLVLPLPTPITIISDLRRSCVESSFVVRYKPQDASEAVADRVDRSIHDRS